MTMSEHNKVVDFLVIGGGMAGISVAARLAEYASVIVVEQEQQPAYHTTGRSAAMFLEAYGPDEIRILTAASRTDYESGLQKYTPEPLLTPKDTYNIARSDQMKDLLAMRSDPVYPVKPDLLDAATTQAKIPLLRTGYAEASFREPDAREIDVNGLLQVFLGRFRQHGGELLTSARVTAINNESNNRTGGLRVTTTAGDITARVIVNAAGAWADEIAGLAGIEPLGLQPKRRTIAVIEAPSVADYEAMPFVADTEESFYLKPDAGRFLISPADETPSLPVDAQAEEMDIAIVVDRVEKAFDFEVGRILQSWAGLRSFFADGVPVCGFHPGRKDFFWLAGQGGYGIQTAPALSRVAADLLLDRQPAKDVAELGAGYKRLAPDRFL